MLAESVARSATDGSRSRRTQKPRRRSANSLHIRWHTPRGSGCSGSEAKVSSPHYPLYLFVVSTGVRIGEALGLTWRDLSLRGCTVTISQALQRPKGGGFTLKEP